MTMKFVSLLYLAPFHENHLPTCILGRYSAQRSVVLRRTRLTLTSISPLLGIRYSSPTTHSTQHHLLIVFSYCYHFSNGYFFFTHDRRSSFDIDLDNH